ncbi:MAG: hypothetical protein P1U68_05585 [Verrucomicrobiales bacterium]|nr:hypothetical protein [Verrucomicrobiales bacterium]
MNLTQAAAISAFLLAFAVTSCSSAKKKKQDDTLGILGQLSAEPVLSHDAVERLKEIADSPNATLTHDSEATGSDLDGLAMADDTEPESGVQEATSDESEIKENTDISQLVASWEKKGLNPRSIQVGDIFSDHAGPILKKAASLADRLNGEDWTKTVNSVTEQRGARVPVTLSVAEINALKDRAPLDAAFPTRSVALDFRTVAQSVRKSQLEKLYELISDAPEKLTITDEKALKTMANELKEVKARLKDGEQLYVITGVTRSDEMDATYPGAPLGSVDVGLIQNAVTALYPHLDDLKADKAEESVRITRNPSIYWEFEVRELKLNNDQLVIDNQALAQI